MNYRMNYRIYPIDYVEELKQKGVKGRRKAMAFMSYSHDMQMDEVNSIRFYAELWEIPKSTAMDWIKEFRDEIERFYAFWPLKNETHYKSVRKKIGHSPDKIRPADIPLNRDYEQMSRTDDGLVSDKEFNIYDDDRDAVKISNKDRAKFNNLYFIYRMNTKYAGKKEEALKEYLKIKDEVSYDKLIRAAVLYLRDPNISKKYNLTNFLKNEIYLSYIPKRMRLKINGEWIEGEYKDDEQMFVGDNGFKGVLVPQRLAELFANKELEFIKE
ncbi:hypothetical protein C3L23_06170 [Nautilia sp. PV-1]|uniref:hypothetical protein n=1 Tax=Nautilia sp. PV-1 TaxID=2579250 RepID=UPI000FD83E64|nr:hypothetical protein [Nautilia sp. PV-1]AZV46872.1 hypothetical protein C3L23_06170 [Nautilia sp. PV-1]